MIIIKTISDYILYFNFKFDKKKEDSKFVQTFTFLNMLLKIKIDYIF